MSGVGRGPMEVPITAAAHRRCVLWPARRIRRGQPFLLGPSPGNEAEWLGRRTGEAEEGRALSVRLPLEWAPPTLAMCEGVSGSV